MKQVLQGGGLIEVVKLKDARRLTTTLHAGQIMRKDVTKRITVHRKIANASQSGNSCTVT